MDDDSKYTTIKPDTTPIREICSPGRAKNTAEDIIAQTTRVALLHSVLARYQNQLPGNGYLKSTGHSKSDAKFDDQYSMTSPRAKSNVLPNTSSGWDSSHQLRTNPVDRNVPPVETTWQTSGTEGLTSNNSPPSYTLAVLQPRIMNTKPAPILINGENGLFTSQAYEWSPYKVKAIEDKVTLFGSKLESRANRSTEVKDSSFIQIGSPIAQRMRAAGASNNVDDSRRLFEKGLNTEDVSNIINEFREIEIVEKLTKRDGIVGRRKTLKGPSLTSSRRLIELKDGKMDGASGDAKGMIVREAECGLKEPMPLRLAEVRRIIFMCREQLGTPQLRRRAMSEPPRR